MTNKVIEYNICNRGIRWQNSKYINVMLRIFAATVLDSEISTLQIIYLNNLDQGNLG